MPDPSFLPSQLAAGTDLLLRTLVDFPAERFNQKPGPLTWSAAEIAEHLMLVDSSVNRVLTGPAAPPPPERLDKSEHIRANLLLQPVPMEAYGPIVPSPGPKEKRALLHQLQSTRDILRELIQTLDLHPVCLGFAHPLFGELTRAEWGWYVLYHGERHLGQVKRLLG
jgi:hypothetical protein